MILIVWSATEHQTIARAQWDKWAVEMAREGVPTPFAYEIDGERITRLHNDTAEIAR